MIDLSLADGVDPPPRCGQLLPRGQGNARGEAAAKRSGRRRRRQQREWHLVLVIFVPSYGIRSFASHLLALTSWLARTQTNYACNGQK